MDAEEKKEEQESQRSERHAISKAESSDEGFEPDADLADEEPRHPIALAIDHLLHRVRDIEVCAAQFIPVAIDARIKRMEVLESMFEEASQSNIPNSPQSEIIKTKTLLDAIWKTQRQMHSNTPAVLEGSLFLGVFSAYDAFTGELLRAVYARKPELFARFERQISISELLRYDSFEKLKEEVLDAEIETFRRKSYVEQFAELEKTFSVALVKFED